MVSFKKSFLERKGEDEERREVGAEGKRKNVPVLNEVVLRKKKFYVWRKTKIQINESVSP